MRSSRSALYAMMITLGLSALPFGTYAAAPAPLFVPTDAPVAPRAQEQKPQIEVVFVLDTTGSMSGLIEGAKKKIWSIASRIAQGTPTPHLRVGLVGYRDRGDAYITQRFDLTDNLDQVFEDLSGFQAAGGGDTPEHVGQALGEAVKLFSWSQDKRTLKMIFVVGDAPPQQYGDGWDYRDWAKRSITQGIMVNTVRCGGDPTTETAFREIANLADGQFVSIDGTGGMMASATPYDDEIARVAREISDTAVYAGRAPARGKAEEKKRVLAAMESEAAADRAGYMAKAGGSAAPAAPVAGARDLVAEEPAAASSVSADELPDDLKGLSAEQRKAKLAALKTKRAELERELARLNRQREEHIVKHAAEKEDSFDGAVMKEVRSKAAKIGVTYK